MKPHFLFLVFAAILVAAGCSKNPVQDTASQRPVVSSIAVTAVTPTSATVGGDVTGAGGSDVTARGICFGTEHNPVVTGTTKHEGSGLGRFYSTIGGLDPGVEYFFRAFAQNAYGTSYGAEMSFRTSVDTVPPVVVTEPATSLVNTTALLGGTVTSTGSSNVTERGIFLNMVGNPTPADRMVSCGSGTGSFSSTVTGLYPGTKYYFRAYAVNGAGMTYGLVRTFTIPIAILFMPGSYQEWDPADSNSVLWSPAGNNKYEVYRWQISDIQYKFTQGPDWTINYGDDNGDGTLERNGSSIWLMDQGVIKINADLNNMVHSHYLLSSFSILGTATLGGWDTDTEMENVVGTVCWTLNVALTAGMLKFRANHSWDLNYGDNDNDGFLDQDGQNIVVPEAGNYLITVDFGHAVYSYSIKKMRK
jgi:starch-binding outer membrane protein SusE/F